MRGRGAKGEAVERGFEYGCGCVNGCTTPRVSVEALWGLCSMLFENNLQFKEQK